LQLALRPYVTTGIALVGASVIAMSPISPVTPDIHVRSINVSSAAVQLAAIANPAADPFTVWGEVIGSTVKNTVGMAGQVLGSGAPVLTQILANQVGYANQIGAAVKNTITGLSNWQSTNQWLLDYAFSLLKAGQLGDAMTYYIYAAAGVVTALFPMIDILSIPGAMLKNLGNAVAQLPAAVMALGIGGVLGLIEGPALAFANQVQTFINTTSAGNLLGAVNTVLNTPAVMVDAFLNGFTFPGLLSPFNGNVSTGLLGALLVGIPKMIANAIKPPAPPVAPAAVESAPDTLAADASNISNTAISAIGGTGTITLSPVTETPVEGTPVTETPVEETPLPRHLLWRPLLRRPPLPRHQPRKPRSTGPPLPTPSRLSAPSRPRSFATVSKPSRASSD
jgi:hypothetical protein